MKSCYNHCNCLHKKFFMQKQSLELIINTKDIIYSLKLTLIEFYSKGMLYRYHYQGFELQSNMPIDSLSSYSFFPFELSK